MGQKHLCTRIINIPHPPDSLGIPNFAGNVAGRSFHKRRSDSIFNRKRMKTVLIVVGKTQNRQLDALIEDYRGRIGHYVPFSMEVQPELRNTRGLSFEQQKEREGKELLGRIQNGDWVILLDERGKEMRSVEFAAFLDKRMQSSRKRLVFIIGGPYGVSDEVYQRADELFSLSKMTFSHQMVRLIFVEQLYRGLSILNGEPYHHESE